MARMSGTAASAEPATPPSVAITAPTRARSSTGSMSRAARRTGPAPRVSSRPTRPAMATSVPRPRAAAARAARRRPPRRSTPAPPLPGGWRPPRCASKQPRAEAPWPGPLGRQQRVSQSVVTAAPGTTRWTSDRAPSDERPNPSTTRSRGALLPAPVFPAPVWPPCLAIPCGHPATPRADYQLALQNVIPSCPGRVRAQRVSVGVRVLRGRCRAFVTPPGGGGHRPQWRYPPAGLLPRPPWWRNHRRLTLRVFQA